MFIHFHGGFTGFLVVISTSLLLNGCFSSGGSNNPPVAGDPITTTVDEGSASVSGQLTSTDEDEGATAEFTITDGSSTPDGFVLNSNGGYSFDPAHASYDHLNVGDSEVLTIPVTVTDDKGATDTTQIRITVNGTNDAPLAGADVTNSVDAGDAVINGLLTSTDVDDGATATFSITGGATAPAGFTLNPDGHFEFDPADPAYASLIAGNSQLVTVFITVTDDNAASDTLQIQITVNGIINAPITTDDTYNTFGNTLLEVGVAPSGSIAVQVSGSVLDNDTDLDTGDVLTATVETAPSSGATVVMNAQGNFTYTPPPGQTSIIDSFTYLASDGSHSTSGTVNINITERIWYVDNRSASGLGTSEDPFASIAEAQLVVADGDTIYLALGDGTTTGLDAGLTLSVPDVSLIGAGEALVINGTTLAAAGTAPSITNPGGPGLTLNAADNTLIMGLNINAVSGDGIVIDDSTGIVIDGITISNSGESAIQGSGADVGFSLTDVIIENVDTVDPTVSDDAIFIAASTSSSLTMSGGSISGVPGNLGDAIEFENADSSNPVSMSLDIRGVTFSGIRQDGIKLDNDHGVMDVQIGGNTIAEGNIFDVGFRAIQIQTDTDTLLSRTNRIYIQHNNITSGNEGIQIRTISDTSNLSILDNILTRALTGNASDLIDIQAEATSVTQAHINNNNISNVGGSDGVRARVFNLATLTLEALNNSIDGPSEGFDFDVFASGSLISDSFLNASILDNALSNISSQAMNARNVTDAAEICMDLQGNSTVADYVIDAVVGNFLLTSASQTIVLDPGIGSFSDTVSCPVPTF